MQDKFLSKIALDQYDQNKALESRRYALQILLWGTVAGMSGFNFACMSRGEKTEILAPGESGLARGLLSIHKILTRGMVVSLEHLHQYISAGRIPQEEAAGYLMYVSSLRFVLHAHHLAEDEIVFPYFRTKFPSVPFDKLKADHQKMASLLESIKEKVTELESNNAGTASLVDLGTLLESLHSIWVPHIKIEESNFTSEQLNALVPSRKQQHLREEIGKHNQKNQDRPLAVPFLLYNLKGNDRTFFLGEFPWMVKSFLVPVVWKKQWEPMKPFLLS